MANRKREGKVTQKEMVREALDSKGWQASPLELQTFIRDAHGVELANNVISNYKSNIKKEGGTGAATGAKPAGKSPAGLNLADLEAVKGLVNRLGAEQVKKLAAMFE